MRLRSIAISGLLLGSLFGTVRAQECDPNDPTLVLPNLSALPPRRARVVQREGIRRLYFTSVYANLGVGPLVLVGKTVQDPTTGQPVTLATQVVTKTDGTTCTHDAGTFVFHPSHNHWHFTDFAQYELRKDDPLTGELVAVSTKVSFCLIDVEPQRGFPGTRQVYSQCGVQQGIQGISSGWADVYDDFYPEQWIELDLGRDEPVPAGGYFLVNITNPHHNVLESNQNDDAGFVSVSVPGLIGSGPPPTPTPTSAVPPPTPTPPIAHPTRMPRPPRPTRVPPIPRPVRTPIVRNP